MKNGSVEERLEACEEMILLLERSMEILSEVYYLNTLQCIKNFRELGIDCIAVDSYNLNNTKDKLN